MTNVATTTDRASLTLIGYLVADPHCAVADPRVSHE